MDLLALLRRTNKLEIDPEKGLITKTYRNYPYTVLPQVALGLRGKSALDGQYRATVEREKIERLRQAGFLLAQEYLEFRPQQLVMRYVGDFVNVEQRMRDGIPMQTALILVSKCAAQLHALHSEGIIQGDPYLENFRLIGEMQTPPFDFEQQYNSKHDTAMDGAIFLGHAVQVLRDCGHLQSRRDILDLIDAIDLGYPKMPRDAPQGKLYLALRFG